MAKNDELVDSLPPGLCCYVLGQVSLAVAVKNRQGKFVWCNRAYEEMLGLSIAELRVRKWSDVTFHEDIGGEQANWDSILSGEINSFCFVKKYRDKSGNEVQRQTRFWRWPRENNTEVEFVIVEAGTDACTIDDLRELASTLHNRLDSVENMAKQGISKRRDTNVGNVVNSDRPVIMLIGAVVFLMCIVGFLAYYLFAKPGQVAPPSPPAITVDG